MLRRLVFVLVAAAGIACSQQPGGDADYFGVWWRGGPDAARLVKRCPWIKGVFVAVQWKDLEPADDQFDWQSFDETFARYADAGLAIQYVVLVGPHSPRWTYAAGVPDVQTTTTLNPHGKPHAGTYPFYLDENYKRFYHRMLRSVAAHIDTLPPAIRKKVVCVETGEGATRDEGGLPDEKWRAFQFEAWKLFDSLYRPKSPPIHILTNSGNARQDFDWLQQNLPDWWREARDPGLGFQLNDEKDVLAWFDPLINHPESGVLVRARSEMDEMFRGWFQEAPVWNMYWLNLWGLHFGLDIFQHETEAFENPAFDEGFRFYAKYGGHKNAATSPGAFCALHDGLDAADFSRFPAAKFGGGKLQGTKEEETQGLQRTLNIAKALAAYGAKQGTMNDVGWNIEAGNYERYMTQFEPNATSQGYWRQGPKDQGYGRFARGFDVKSGKNNMYFDIAERFFGGKPLAARYPVTLRIIYLDTGTGSWALQYDAASDPHKTAIGVTKTNSKRWEEINVTLRDAWFAKRGPKGADFTFVNTSNENTLFHLVEVTRVSPE